MKADSPIATWELWSVATMLVSTRGEQAEAYAETKITEACADGSESEEIVWRGVLTQLCRIREKERG